MHGTYHRQSTQVEAAADNNDLMRLQVRLVRRRLHAQVERRVGVVVARVPSNKNLRDLAVDGTEVVCGRQVRHVGVHVVQRGDSLPQRCKADPRNADGRSDCDGSGPSASPVMGVDPHLLAVICDPGRVRVSPV